MRKYVKLGTIMLLGILLCGLLCACGKEEADKVGDVSSKASESSSEDMNSSGMETKGNYDVFECIQKINPDNTLAEINEIIGFEGEDISSKGDGKVYYWQLTEDTGVQVQFFDSGNAEIGIDFKNKSIANAKNDFSKFSEIKEKLDAGEKLTYDEFVKIIGGVEGVLEKKSTTTNGYTWVDKNGGYLIAQFDAETMECKIASGMF